MNNIDLNKIKDIDLSDYLQKRGMKPYGRGKHRKFISPFGEESNPSFFVNTATNKFRCYHSGNYGDIIDFVMLHDNKTFTEACAVLSGNEILNIETFKVKKEKKGIEIVSEGTCTNDSVMKYFTLTRKIPKNIVKKYCKEVEVSFPYGKFPEKTYVAFGMKNSLGGYDFRNSYMKMASSPKSFTKIQGESSDKFLLFEGFIDWLSYCVINNFDIPRFDAYILNGLGMINVLMPMLSEKEAISYLDNGDPADRVMSILKNACPSVRDMRYEFNGYEDLNAFLVGRES